MTQTTVTLYQIAVKDIHSGEETFHDAGGTWTEAYATLDEHLATYRGKGYVTSYQDREFAWTADNWQNSTHLTLSILSSGAVRKAVRHDR